MRGGLQLQGAMVKKVGSCSNYKDLRSCGEGGGGGGGCFNCKEPW